jgi:hypothetical protein
VSSSSTHWVGCTAEEIGDLKEEIDHEDGGKDRRQHDSLGAKPTGPRRRRTTRQRELKQHGLWVVGFGGLQREDHPSIRSLSTRDVREDYPDQINGTNINSQKYRTFPPRRETPPLLSFLASPPSIRALYCSQ